jgi:uncharacterized protein (TIGR02996 family)
MVVPRPKRIPPDPLPVEPWLRQFPSVEGFLRAIAEEPWDDVHRLIFADWLDEHGATERAEFIRLQCQLAGRERWETPEGAIHREQQLRATHWAEWQRGLPAGVLFERGLATMVSLHPENTTARLNDAARVIDLQEISWPATSYRADVTSWAQALVGCPALRTVTAIRLSGPLSSDEGVEELVRSPHLGRLSRVKLPPFPLRLTRAGLRTLLQSQLLAGPYELDLRSHTLATPGAELLACWPGLAAVSVLYLHETQLGENGIRDLFGSPHRPALTRLDLSRTEARISTGEVLAATASLASLTSLDLGNNLLRDEGARALACSPHLGRLEALNLRDNQIGNTGARALAESPILARLRFLDLGQNSFGLTVRRQLLARWPFARC